ncbi:hypothetical protein [Nonomuraea fuscirosea]|uniref:hypothetical protein n=1 Tax=Nonomuraea fuscirosea TaxID=1291556 RepID=UPI0033FA0784
MRARNVLDLRTADWTALRAMCPQVEGYSLESWIGPATPGLLPDLAAVMAGMNDAPRDGDIDYGIDRVRAYEERIPDGEETCYTTIARRDRDGAPAGYTRIFVSTDRTGGWADQGDTTVSREHRGPPPGPGAQARQPVPPAGARARDRARHHLERHLQRPHARHQRGHGVRALRRVERPAAVAVAGRTAWIFR